MLHEIIDKELRLEITYGLIRQKGFQGLDRHGGGHWDGGGQDLQFVYRHHNGKIFCGNTVVAFNFTDVSDSEGGFLCVPDSHKANFEMPQGWRSFYSTSEVIQRMTPNQQTFYTEVYSDYREKRVVDQGGATTSSPFSNEADTSIPFCGGWSRL